MQQIRPQIELTSMEKTKEEEFLNLKNEAAKIDLMRAQRVFGDQTITNTNAEDI